MEILVTGGLGHIGSALIRNIPSKHNLTICDDLSTERYCSLFKIERKYTFVHQDYLKLKYLDRFDAIIHLAAKTNATQSIDSEKEYFQDYKKTREFITKIENTQKNIRFIFPSSTSVYGTSAKIVDENSIVNPQSPYAEVKLKIEDEIRNSSIYRNSTIFRFGTIFGKSPGMRFHTFVNKACYQAAFDEPITIWRDNYKFYRPYLGINDCVRAILMSINHIGFTERTLNALSINRTTEDIVNIIRRMIRPRRELDLNFVDTPLLNQFSYMTDYHIIKTLGFKPEDNLAMEIMRTLRMLGS